MPSNNSIMAMVGGLAGSALAWKFIDSKYMISKDLGVLKKLAHIKAVVAEHSKNKNTLADIWETTCRNNWKKDCFIFEGERWSFGRVEMEANRFASYLKESGFKKGDVIALYMENCPQFFATWIGAAKLGVISALINFNVKGKPLVHCLKIAGAKMLVLDAALQHQIEDCHESITALGMEIVTRFGSCPFAECIDDVVAKMNTKRLPRSARRGIRFQDKALLIYTSGTTGLPKAATVTHQRVFLSGFSFGHIFEVKPDDRVYTVLPLYHSAGGNIGVGLMMIFGVTIVLKKKFSLKQFWPDCRKYKVTVFQYIGELLRYLLSAPPTDKDRKNLVRLAIGNGLRPDIWAEFQERFNIPEVGEFYGSTEGTATLFNFCTDKESQGAVGFTGPLVKSILKYKVVQFDVVEEKPLRGPNGFCIECKPGEVGELIAEIDPSNPIAQFNGYHGNAKATAKKFMMNCFRKDDKWFRTGDLLRWETNGLWFFADRIGDTFRWKGENVSTNEVAEVITGFPGIKEVNIYGVEVPGQADGRACMAALCLESNEDFDFQAFAKHCTQKLPPYSVPLFLRLLPTMVLTGTFKQKKVQYRKEGCNPAVVADPLLSFDKKNMTYVPMSITSKL